MGWMVRHAEELLNELSDTCGRPHVADKPKGGRTFRQCSDQFRALLHGKPWCRPRSCTSPQGHQPARAAAFHPLTPRPLCPAQGCRNILLFPPVLVQFPGALASSFPPINGFVLPFSCHVTRVPKDP